MITHWRDFWRKRRLNLYRQLIQETPLNPTDAKRIPQELRTVWQAVKPQDVLQIDPRKQAVISISTWTQNLPDLVHALTVVNRCIREKVERELEVFLDRFTERHDQSLAFYLADDELRGIDEEALINRLRGLLQEHCHLLQTEENQYYQRLTTKFYQDAISLLSVLVYSVDL